jgi:hypothetical protein
MFKFINRYLSYSRIPDFRAKDTSKGFLSRVAAEQFISWRVPGSRLHYELIP